MQTLSKDVPPTGMRFFRQIRWLDYPREKGFLCGTTEFLIVPFFFRGREGDFHWCRYQRLGKAKIHFTILSMDTAVHLWLGDLHHTSEGRLFSASTATLWWYDGR